MPRFHRDVSHETQSLHERIIAAGASADTVHASLRRHKCRNSIAVSAIHQPLESSGFYTLPAGMVYLAHNDGKQCCSTALPSRYLRRQ